MTPYQTRSGQMPSNLIQNVNQLSNSTSDFRAIDIISLNVVFYDADSADIISSLSVEQKIKTVLPEVFVSNADAHTIKECMNNPIILENFSGRSKTFAQLMAYVLENESVVVGTSESRTDAFVNHVLEKLEFGEYPLMIQPQPLYKFKIYNKEISAKLYFAVLKNRHVLLVDEDKHIANTGATSGWGEYQLAGEIIAAAYCNYNRAPIHYKETIHAVRVIGLRFTFYKAIVSKNYLLDLGNGIPLPTSLSIFRYPPSVDSENFPFLNFADPQHRIRIIELLVKIREELIHA